MKYWSKTILTVYNYLEEMSQTIDKIVTDTGVRSNNRSLLDYQTTTYQTGKIIELTDRKRKIINLKVIIEKVLSKLPSVERQILKLSYIEGIKSEFISQILNVSMRTFFRQKNKALDDFKEMLIKLGFGLKYFKKEYGGESWLTAIYNECLLRCTSSNDLIDASIIRYAIRQVPKIDLYKKVGTF